MPFINDFNECVNAPFGMLVAHAINQIAVVAPDESVYNPTDVLVHCMHCQAHQMTNNFVLCTLILVNYCHIQIQVI